MNQNDPIGRRAVWLEQSWFVLAILAAGIALRVMQYLYNRSMYIDEAAVALNLRRPLSELLTEPLYFSQTAAPAFLAQQKILMTALGESEYALRLVPLLAGIAALPLFLVVAQRILSRAAAAVALALMAFSAPLIYFAADSKPYSVDVLATIVLIFVALRLEEQDLTWRQVASAILIGGSLAWYSQPAVFVLTAVSISLLGQASRRDQQAKSRRLLTIVMGWTISAAAASMVMSRTVSPGQRAYMQDFWSTGFFPLIPRSATQALWLPTTLMRVSSDVVGGEIFGAFGAIAILWGLLRLGQLKRTPALLIALPIAVTLLASAAHVYPFAGGFGAYAARVVIFLAPCFLLAIAAGAQSLMRHAGLVSASAIAGLLVAVNLGTLGVMFPITRDETRPLLESIANQVRPGDRIYVYYGIRHVYTWYADKVGLDDVKPIIGSCARGNPSIYLDELATLPAGTHLWIIFAHVLPNEWRLLLAYLDLNGKRLYSTRATGAAASLYELSGSHRIPADPRLYQPPDFARVLGCRGLYVWPRTVTIGRGS